MTGDGLNELLEALLLQAEMMELRADDKVSYYRGIVYMQVSLQ